MECLSVPVKVINVFKEVNLSLFMTCFKRLQIESMENQSMSIGAPLVFRQLMRNASSRPLRFGRTLKLM